MPLSNDGSLIPGLAQKLRYGLLRAIEGATVVLESIQVTVLACQNDSSTWPTNGIRDIAAIKSHALVCDAI
jgi:hypothetical protein